MSENTDPGLFDNQAAYDQYIQPRLKELAALCRLHGMQFAMMIVFSHTHDEGGACEHGAGLSVEIHGEKAGINCTAASIVMKDSDAAAVVLRYYREKRTRATEPRTAWRPLGGRQN